MMDRWNAAGAKVLSRDKRKSSPRWFELSAEVLLPAIEEKKRATKKFYQIGDASSKIKLTKLRRQVADLVEAAKIRWIEKKVEEIGANQPDLIWQLPSKASYRPTIPTLGETVTSSRSTNADPHLTLTQSYPTKFTIAILFLCY